MRAYGKEPWEPEDDDAEEPPPVSLQGVTLACSFADIRRVARFINDIVAMIDSGHYTGKLHGHAHFQDMDASWTREESDLILYWDPSYVEEPRYTGS
jgi:hypothetical protein